MAPDLARLLAQLEAGAQPRLAGRFRLEARLGAGAMGVVLRAQDLELGRPVALKLLTRRGPKPLARLRREASLATRVSHPNVVRVFGLAEEEGLILICELVPGARTLDEAWEELGLARRLDLVEQVAAGLSAVHRAGVVHRDLKPTNVLVDAEGRARVTDFGLARSDELELERLTATGTLVGTPHYMSPEQAQGRTQVDARADVWALGVLLYEGLMGELPFESESLPGLLYAIGHSEVRLGWKVPAPLRRVCSRALSKDPAGRYADAAEFAEALRDARRGSSSLHLPALAGGVIAAAVLGASLLYGQSSSPSLPSLSPSAAAKASPAPAAQPSYPSDDPPRALALAEEQLYLETDAGVEVIDLVTHTRGSLQAGKRLSSAWPPGAEPLLQDAARDEGARVALGPGGTLLATPAGATLRGAGAPALELPLDGFTALFRRPLLSARHAILVRGGLTNGASIRIWDRAGALLSLEGSDESYLTPRCAALSPAGRWLAVGCRSGLLAVFDLQDRASAPLMLQDPAQSRSTDPVAQLTPMAHARTLCALAFPSENELLSSDDVTLCLWDLERGELRESRPVACRALAAQPTRGRVAYGLVHETWVLPWRGRIPTALGPAPR